MIGYIGTTGALQALPYQGGLSVDSDRPVGFTRTLGGKRKAFLSPRSRREWSVSFDLIGSKDTLGLLAVAQQGGPVLWYPADAASGNLFSPQAARFDTTPANSADGGLVALPDGTVARSVLHAGTGLVYIGGGGTSTTAESVPVTAGQKITVGVWARGGSRMTGSWRNAAGTHISTPDSGTQSAAGWVRHTATLTAPAGAVAYQMALSAGTQYARPSVAWGAVDRDRPGRGCPAAVVSGLSEALTVIRPDDAYGSIDLTVTEVG